MLRKLLSIIVLTFTCVSFALAQQGSLKGKVIDSEIGEPLPFVNVVVESNGTQVAGGTTDFDGKFNIKPIPPGSYDVKAKFVGYKPLQISGVVVKADKITFQDLKLATTAIEIEEFEVIEYTVPLIDKDNTSGGGTITKEDIAKMPGRSATAIAQTVGGVYAQDDGSGDLSVRGGRSDANYYFIDGIKVRGSSNLPQSAIEQVTVITGGLPAQYGDVTGGVISITTRGASKDFFGGVEYITSGYKFGDRMVGLDQYGYNLLEFSVSGPLLSKKDTAGNKTEPLVGFFLAGNATHIVDERPSANGVWKVKDEVFEDLIANPLRRADNGAGTFQNAEFLRLNDLEKVKTTQNAAKRGITLQGKLDFNIGSNANFTVGGNIDYNNRRNNIFNGISYDNSLFNSANNQELLDIDWRVYARFTQRFSSNTQEQEQESASTLKNAFYTIQYDYQENIDRRWDDTHKDNLFGYGYVGQFKAFQAASYSRIDGDVSQGIPDVINHETFEDTLISFVPSETNPIAAQYTKSYYELFGWDFDNSTLDNPIYDRELAQDPTRPEELNFFLRNFDNIRSNGGLINGDDPRQIYSLWESPALQSEDFIKGKTNQNRFTASGSADIGDHAISVGVEYEQRTDRRYTISPRAMWTRARQYANGHITDLCNDPTDPNCLASIVSVGGIGISDSITYGRLNTSIGAYDAFDGDESQTFFDYNLRSKLGLDTDGTDWIDFDSYDPSTFDVGFFSADELLSDRASNGIQLTYYGYDHKGNIARGNPSVDDFFTKRDEFGNFTRPINAFRPIYMAGYIQDKFSFDDLVFNIGLRVDRFDANQSVLKDEFVFFPTIKAGEQDVTDLLAEDGKELPETIGEDYVVYVDNLENPSKVVGYRNGTTWFDSEGTEIDDASSLRTPTGIAPLLKDKTKTEGRDISGESFRDYTPQNTFMPRVSFSFPISDEALFFAHYDVLAKRPTSGANLNLIDYYYIENLGGRLINNPNLKSEKTIDYELGFQQKLNNSSSLKLSAFYREVRDLVQVVSRQDAFPTTYLTLDNLDFSTVKGLTVVYDLRRTGNVRANISYTLQFADGTGSSSTSGFNLANSGQPNLRTLSALDFDQRHALVASIDYRYASGKDYNGPILMDKQILANTGVNFVARGGSGTPYNGQRQATPRATLSPQGGSLQGQINGSRLPFSYTIDARIDRDIALQLGKEDSKKEVNMNIYLQVLNVLNNINILDVYRFTGNPDDDGFLVDARFQNDISTRNDEQSYRELYSIKVNDPSNYSLPRRLRLGVMLNF